MRAWYTLTLFFAIAGWTLCSGAGNGPLIRVETTRVEGGGELLTYFGRLPDHHAGGVEIPLVSVLRDTMGDADPDNDRVRQVWGYGYLRPTLWQRFSAAVPFLYRRAGGDRRRNVKPSPLLDMANPGKGTLPRLVAAAVQSNFLDPLGITYRASTRAYRGRSSEYRQMQVFRALEVLRTTPEEAGGLSGDDLTHLEGRLVLSNQLLGGLVSESYAPEAWNKKRARSSAYRGTNWELLRQKSEENGLVFEPLRIGSDESNFAMIWIEQDRAEQPFDGKFLGFSDPYRDGRVQNWRGYSEVWNLDEEGKRTATQEAGTRRVHMVPLGLYALDYPKVPLLLIDFREPSKMKRREMAWRFTDDVATGVLGLTGWGHWPYMLAKSSWFYVHGRQGAPLNRSARVEAYVNLRQGLLMDRSLNPGLHQELVHGVDRLGWNPFEEDVNREVGLAGTQYQALLDKGQAKMARDLDQGRLREIQDQIHKRSARVALRSASIFSLGLYRHHDTLTPERFAAVNHLRRKASGEKQQAIISTLPPPIAAVQAGGGQ